MSPLPLFARALRCAAAVFAFTALLSGCDSSSRIEDYVPTRVISFGDELSLINGPTSGKTVGSKYSINGFATSSTTTLDCTVNPIWNQALATNFGLAFSDCPGAIASPNGLMNAVPGATVNAVAAQVNAVPADQFVPSTLVTIQGGMWDVISAYNTYKTNANRDAAFALVRAAGAQLAGLVNRIANNGAGARVLYATVPDLGYSPLAITEQAAAGTCVVDCRQFLIDLSAAFNESLRVNVLNDGRYAGLVAFDDMLRSMANPTIRTTVYGLINTDAATSVAACTNPDTSLCDTTTLVPELAGSATGYLWASDRLPGPNWHSRVAGVAITRARNNPF